MKRLVWKLGAFLATHGATPYQLETRLRATLALEAERSAQASREGWKVEGATEGEGKGKRPVSFSPNTIYSWAKATRPPERLQTATLERILRALELIAGREVDLSEILAWEDRPEHEERRQAEVKPEAAAGKVQAKR